MMNSQFFGAQALPEHFVTCHAIWGLAVGLKWGPAGARNCRRYRLRRFRFNKAKIVVAIGEVTLGMR
jgi:hypothetical protein